MGYSDQNIFQVLLNQSTHSIYTRGTIKCIFKIWSEWPLPVPRPHIYIYIYISVVIELAS